MTRITGPEAPQRPKDLLRDYRTLRFQFWTTCSTWQTRMRNISKNMCFMLFNYNQPDVMHNATPSSHLQISASSSNTKINKIRTIQVNWSWPVDLTVVNSPIPIVRLESFDQRLLHLHRTRCCADGGGEHMNL